MTISDRRVNDVVVRRDEHAGWRLEVPDENRPGGVFATIVADKESALKLAADMYPTAKIRVFDGPPTT